MNSILRYLNGTDVRWYTFTSKEKGIFSKSMKNIKHFEAINNESMISDYNRQSRCGITGVHAQALYLMAMGHIFFKRFGISPISMENNVLEMKGQIKLSGDTFEFVE